MESGLDITDHHTTFLAGEAGVRASFRGEKSATLWSLRDSLLATMRLSAPPPPSRSAPEGMRPRRLALAAFCDLSRHPAPSPNRSPLAPG